MRARRGVTLTSAGDFARLLVVGVETVSRTAAALYTATTEGRDYL